MEYSITFPMYCLLVFLVLLYFSVFSVLSTIFQSRYERRGEFSIKNGSDWDVHQMRELLYQNRSVHRHLDLRQRRVYSVPHCPFVRLMISTVLFRCLLHCFKRIDSFSVNLCCLVLSSIRLKYVVVYS